MTSKTHYFLKDGNKENGPFSQSEIKALSDNGSLTIGMQLRKADASTWTSVTKVRGLNVAGTPTEDLDVHTSSKPGNREQASSSDPWLAGICTSWSKRSGIHPILIRALFYLLWPISIPVYAVLAFRAERAVDQNLTPAKATGAMFRRLGRNTFSPMPIGLKQRIYWFIKKIIVLNAWLFVPASGLLILIIVVGTIGGVVNAIHYSTLTPQQQAIIDKERSEKQAERNRQSEIAYKEFKAKKESLRLNQALNLLEKREKSKAEFEKAWGLNNPLRD